MPDLAIYGVHALYWASFGVTHWILGRLDRAAAAPPDTAKAASAETAPHSRALVAFHAVGFGLLYFGLGNAVIPNRVPHRFPLQWLAGAAVIALGAFLMCWALVWFRSWRFRAKVESGHELATGGPFALVRHPIYMGLNLLGIGSALWVPTATVAVAALLLVVGSDLRARAEETLLSRVFGERYRAYCARTRRFVPGVY
jgi:protein-S-isoprenylcysteine O-methyltransferase Ste14